MNDPNELGKYETDPYGGVGEYGYESNDPYGLGKYEKYSYGWKSMEQLTWQGKIGKSPYGQGKHRNDPHGL